MENQEWLTVKKASAIVGWSEGTMYNAQENKIQLIQNKYEELIGKRKKIKNRLDFIYLISPFVMQTKKEDYIGHFMANYREIFEQENKVLHYNNLEYDDEKKDDK